MTKKVERVGPEKGDQSFGKAPERVGGGKKREVAQGGTQRSEARRKGENRKRGIQRTPGRRDHLLGPGPRGLYPPSRRRGRGRGPKWPEKGYRGVGPIL